MQHVHIAWTSLWSHILVSEFLQSLLDSDWSPATINVYVATISAHRYLQNGMSLNSHRLITEFPKGAFCLYPPSHYVKTFNIGGRSHCGILNGMPIVLNGLCEAPFEPKESYGIKWLSIISVRWVSEIHAFRLSHWVTEVISVAYQLQGHATPHSFTPAICTPSVKHLRRCNCCVCFSL